MDFAAIWNFDAEVEEHLKNNSNNGSKVSQASIRRMKHLLHVITSNLLASFFEIFRKACTEDTRTFYMGSTVTPSGSCVEMMNSVGREHTFCFKISDNDAIVADNSLHSFKNSIGDLLGEVHDWYILFFWSLHESAQPSQSSSVLEVIWKSDEAFDALHNNQLEPSFHGDIVHSSFNDFYMLDVDDTNGSQ